MLGDLLPAENVGAVAKVNKTVNADSTETTTHGTHTLPSFGASSLLAPHAPLLSARRRATPPQRFGLRGLFGGVR
jgi:hypothetical protein